CSCSQERRARLMRRSIRASSSAWVMVTRGSSRRSPPSPLSPSAPAPAPTPATVAPAPVLAWVPPAVAPDPPAAVLPSLLLLLLLGSPEPAAGSVWAPATTGSTVPSGQTQERRVGSSVGSTAKVSIARG